MIRAFSLSLPSPAFRAVALAFLVSASALLPLSGATSSVDEDDEDGTAKTVAPASALNPARNLAALQLWGENDLGWSDKFYTSGLKIAITTPEVFSSDTPRFFQDLVTLTPLARSSALAPAAYRLHFALTHEFYTPKDEYAIVPRPGDHPYAGMLYGTVGISSEVDSRLDAIELSIGVVGPSARARQVQNGWHRVIHTDLTNGWHTQVRDEPLLQLAWTRIARYDWVQRESLGVDWLPRAHVEIGTVRDYAALGAQWRIGWHLPDDFGIGTIHSSTALTRPGRTLSNPCPTGWFPDSAWLYLDAQVEGWLWNTALDGNAWHESEKVHRYAFVGEISLGVALQWGGVRLNFAEVLRTREFRGQNKEVFDYTTVSLSVAF